MARTSRGVMIRATQSSVRGRGGKAGGKAGKRTLGDGARQAMTEAFANKDAGALVELATIAGQRGRPAASAHLAVQAGLLALESGDVEASVEHARKGIELAEGVANKRRVSRKFWPLLDALAEKDAAAADALRGEIKTRFGLKLVPRAGKTITPNRSQRRALPKFCGSCGAPIDKSTVEFVEDGTLDCALCGDAIV